MDVRIWLVGSVIAGVLSWAINRITKVEDVEWHAATRLQKIGTWISVLLMVVAISPIIAAIATGVFDAVVGAKEFLIELSEVNKSEKLALGLPALFVLLCFLTAYVEYQVQFRHRVGRWTVTLRILQKVCVAFMLVAILTMLVGAAIGVVVLPMMLFRHWPDMHWYEVVGLVVCAVMFYRIVRETFWLY